MPVFTILAVIGVVLAAGYILWMLQRTFYGPVKEQFNGVKDADGWRGSICLPSWS